jgi:transposase-like protein
MVAKRQRRLTGVDDMVISLPAKGLTHGEISAHLAEVYGAEVPEQTITTMTGKHSRPHRWFGGCSVT